MTHPGLFAKGYEPDVPPPFAIANQPSSTAQLRVLAGEAIGGQRVVFVDSDNKAYYSDPDMVSGIYSIGVSYHAADADEELLICIAGRMDFDGWDWIPATVWLAPNGMLTQVVPATGNYVQVGLGTGPFLVVNPRLIAIRN